MFTARMILLLGVFSVPVGAQMTGQDVGRISVPNGQSLRAMAPASLQVKVSLSVSNQTLESAVLEVARQADMTVTYDSKLEILSRRVSVKIKDLSPQEAITTLLKGTGMSARFVPNTQSIVLGAPVKESTAHETTKKQGNSVIVGRVTDSATKQGIPGASVVVPGMKHSVVTSQTGDFLIRGVIAGEALIAVKAFGYKSASKSVVVTDGGRHSVSIVMVGVPTTLSGVVTTATGLQRKIEVGNDVTTIKVEEVIRNNPVSNMSELLATRVPGLYAAPTSGQPGAPTRIRIRGVSSINTSNEPIIVVDGVQIRSEAKNTGSSSSNFDFAFSPLDQLDVNAIETVEVLKGPSAVALYGSDAANGVVVVTTKRGFVGAARWRASARLGTQAMPGRWPQNYFSWGTLASGGLPRHCPNRSWTLASGCRHDSLQVYQLMNDPGTTVFGRGSTREYSLGVSGGVRGITYSFTTSMSRVLGLMKLPDNDVRIVEAEGSKLQSWQRRPQASDQASGTALVSVDVGTETNVELTTSVNRKMARSTPLSNAMETAATFAPPVPQYGPDGSVIQGASGLLEAINTFRERREGTELGSRNTIKINSRGIPSVMNAILTMGVDVRRITSSALLLNGDCYGTTECSRFGTSLPLDSGYAKRRAGSAILSDIKLTLSGSAIGSHWLSMIPSIGGNFVKSRDEDSNVDIQGLPVGSIRGGSGSIQGYSEDQSGRNTLGLYVETRFKVADRLWLPLSIRTDAGSALGSEVMPKFPRLGFSYLLSDQPIFQQMPVIGSLPMVRVRTAFGVAGKQPGVAEKYRTYSQAKNLFVDGIPTTGFELNTIGNTGLRPERSQEWELGFDADVIEHPRRRLSVTVTSANKLTRDLIDNQLLPGSAGGYWQTVNLGDVVNSTFELTVDALMEIRSISWQPSVSLTTLRNRVKALAPTSQTGSGYLFGPDFQNTGLQSRNVVGYPLYGRWAPQVVGYADRNSDGIIGPNEIQLSDSAIFIGAPYPKFTLNTQQQLTMRSSVTLSGVISYENGLTQIRRRGEYSRVENDPTLSLSEQAYGMYSVLTRAQQVSTLRFTSVQINYLLPRSITARIFGGRSVSIKASGKNIGLWSTYRGKDPNVGASGEEVWDQGQLPTPREWAFELGIH